jgi:hypothetical protein
MEHLISAFNGYTIPLLGLKSSPLHGALTDNLQTAKQDAFQVFYPSTNDANSVLSFDEDCSLATL